MSYYVKTKMAKMQQETYKSVNQWFQLFCTNVLAASQGRAFISVFLAQYGFLIVQRVVANSGDPEACRLGKTTALVEYYTDI